ncbi:RHS repeat-associated core domain-containing protein [Krasilnikovia sp. MM14-A1259]|uniref:RHS repeat domain-containing protein n=1 Tax=Krasilnikovia sp. MM14-A1259 TaxID=3373539 RepID=UPI00399D32F1
MNILGSSPAARRVPRWRLALGAVLAGLLATSSLVVTPAQADKTPSVHLPGQKEKFDTEGGEVAGKGWKPKKHAPLHLPAPEWPDAGSATVAVPGRTAKVKSARAGTTPVSVSRGKGAAGDRVSDLTVQVLDRSSLPEQWKHGLVTRVSAPTGGGAATVSVDYRAFRYAYGAGWGSRLRLWQLPPCALTTPDEAACKAVPLPSSNNPAAGTVTADVPVAADSTGTIKGAAFTGDAAVTTVPALDRAPGQFRPAAAATGGTLLAAAAAPSGDAGDYTATSLAPSSTWASGSSSGAFTWSYPMRTPPSSGGPEPKIGLSYSSASVDGRNAATNNQPSWIGEGFDFWPGYIERRYVPCAEDKAGSPNNPAQTADLCWRSDNAVMSLNGSSTELVYESGKGWHGRTENGAKIEKLTGASNGDNDGEHWKVTTTDGTQYFFGLNRPAGQSSDTDSTWTVPVYGNHSGEPCHAAAFTDSDCAQAWRWNLDYVVDTRGNTMSYWYTKELNQYAQEVTSSKNISYVRGGTLARIDYGTWDRGATDRNVNPAAQIVFQNSDRCIATDCTTHDAQHWPDTPWDQECKTSATSCDDYSPTFWSTKRLTKITTRVWDTTVATPAWQDVDSWTFGHTFPATGDGTDPGLWLSSIVHTGLVGTPIALPPVTLEPVSLPNRVMTKYNTSNNWQRLSNIYSETGARTQVIYSTPECTASNLPSAPSTNTKLCYPVIGPDPYDPDGPDITEWWHKYVVRQVLETDVQLADGHQTPTKTTFYTYEGDPAWHYADDDGLSRPKRKTWDQFRGYATVTTQVGDTAKTLTRTTYLRGMNGDKAAPSGGTRTVTVPASLGSETVYDEDQFAGMVREQVTYNGTTDKPVSKTVNVPWRSLATASRTINGDTVTAHYVNTRVAYTGTALGTDGDRGWRVTGSRSDFDDTYGTTNWTQDDGDIAASGDEKCTTYSYNRNTAKNIVTLPRQVTTTALTCGTTPTNGDQVISDALSYYDGATSAGTAPVYGQVTRSDTLKDWTPAGGTAWQTTSRTSYDAFGRQLTTTDIRNNTTTTVYSPATGLVTSRTDTNQLGWVTTTVTNPYWESKTKVSDPNGRLTEITYDGLGRTSQVWNIGWSKAGNPTTPSVRYSYAYSANRSTYPYVQTDTLNAAGNYVTGYQIFDGFLRNRQTQSPAVGGGRIVTDTIYDAWGRVGSTYNPHAEPGTASGTLYWEPEGSVPALTRNLYDRAGRTTDAIFMASDGVTNLVEKWRTTTVYGGDQTTVIPPAGGTPATTVTDARGHTVELRQYTTASGIDGAYDTTKYAYNRKDQRTAVTDPAGDQWTYKYDPRGRQTEANDPDAGRSTSAYNDYNELVTTTDARNNTLAYTYDSLGRKTAVYDNSTTGTKRAEWIYDKLYTGITIRGQMTQSIRYDNGNAYKWQAINFTQRYQPTGANYVIPAVETGLAGTYTYGYGYTATGVPNSISYPAGGNLGGENVTTTYEAVTGLPSSLATNMTNVGSYVSGQLYTAYGEPTVTTLKTTGGVFAEQGTYYDTATRRVTDVKVKPETSSGTVADRTYTYNPAGQITTVADAPQVGTADTQCFTYDPLGRLTTAWTPKAGVDCASTPSVPNLGGPAPYWQDWTVDKIGNRTKEVSHTSLGDTVRTYTTPTPGAGVVRPHAPTAMTTTTPGQSTGTTVNYGYDNSGNQNARPGATASQNLTWDAEGHLTKVVEGASTTTNLFDPDGTRLIRRDATGATLYLPGMEIRRQVSGSTATLTGTRYYDFAGQTVASRTVGTQALTWLFSDHQGTQQISVNAYTQKVDIRRQDPYGGPRGTQPLWPNTKGFVGGTNDPTGLTHIGAREYDPALGRFISVDPVHDLTDPTQWNAYSYSNNDPITHSDPTGLRDDDHFYGPQAALNKERSAAPASAPGSVGGGCASANACEHNVDRSSGPVYVPITRHVLVKTNDPYYGRMSLAYAKATADFHLNNQTMRNDQELGVWYQICVAHHYGEGMCPDGMEAQVRDTVDGGGFTDPSGYINAASVGRGWLVGDDFKGGSRQADMDLGRVVYRGTSRALENWIAEETGLIMSDAAAEKYGETGSVAEALAASREAHNAGIESWGSEDNYVQAHGAFGTEMDEIGPKSMISFTTDPAVAKIFAGPDGTIYVARLAPGQGIVQTMPGAGESEILVPNMIRARPMAEGGGAGAE